MRKNIARIGLSAATLAAIVAGSLLLGNSDHDSTLSAGAGDTEAVPVAVVVPAPQTQVAPLVQWAFRTGTPEAGLALVEAQVAQCMRSRGWSYPDPQTDQLEPGTFNELRAFRRSKGYGAASPSPDLRNYVAGLSPADARRFADDLSDGDREGMSTPKAPRGCKLQAEVAMQMSTPFFNAEAREAIGSAGGVIVESAEFRGASADWKRCMALAGYTYSDIDGPRNEARRSGGQSSKTNIALATADFDCQEKTVLPVRQRLEASAVNELRARFPQYG